MEQGGGDRVCRLPGDAGGDPRQDTPAQAARRAFMGSDVGCGIDLFFGGAPYDFEQQARLGHIVDSGVLQRHPECFTEERHSAVLLPGRSIGTGRDAGSARSSAITEFSTARSPWPGSGSIRRRATWADLQDPRLQGELALADPTRSSSMATAFENVIQQHMQERWMALMVEADRISSLDEKAVESQAIREGWIAGLQCIQLICANARYFTDSSQKVPIDVADGNCAAGMCIDFYGRQQAEAERRRGGSDRLEFVSPAGGTVSSVDPIALLRGAKNRAVALAFIDWVVSLDAQKLWGFKPGTPGGPQRYSLRRMPVRRDFYAREDWKPWRSDPDVSPFDGEGPADLSRGVDGRPFPGTRVHHPRHVPGYSCGTGRAWRVIVAAGRPPEAMAALQDMSAVDYDKTAGEIKAALGSKNKVDEIVLARKLARTFQDQYRRAEELARINDEPPADLISGRADGQAAGCRGSHPTRPESHPWTLKTPIT